MKKTTFGELRVGDYFTRTGWHCIEQVINETTTNGKTCTSKEVLPPTNIRMRTMEDDQDVLAFDDYEEANEWYLCSAAEKVESFKKL